MSPPISHTSKRVEILHQISGVYIILFIFIPVAIILSSALITYAGYVQSLHSIARLTQCDIININSEQDISKSSRLFGNWVSEKVDNDVGNSKAMCYKTRRNTHLTIHVPGTASNTQCITVFRQRDKSKIDIDKTIELVSCAVPPMTYSTWQYVDGDDDDDDESYYETAALGISDLQEGLSDVNKRESKRRICVVKTDAGDLDSLTEIPAFSAVSCSI